MVDNYCFAYKFLLGYNLVLKSSKTMKISENVMVDCS